MTGFIRSKWPRLLITLAVVAILVAVVQSLNKENKTMDAANDTAALDIPIPTLDALVPEVIETATFALG
jgi:hypothetical protein